MYESELMQNHIQVLYIKQNSTQMTKYLAYLKHLWQH
jgi:hypothetical protein